MEKKNTKARRWRNTIFLDQASTTKIIHWQLLTLPKRQKHVWWSERQARYRIESHSNATAGYVLTILRSSKAQRNHSLPEQPRGTVPGTKYRNSFRHAIGSPLRFNMINCSTHASIKRRQNFQWSIAFCCASVMLLLENSHLLGRIWDQLFNTIVSCNSKLMSLHWMRSLAFCFQTYHIVIHVRTPHLCRCFMMKHCATHLAVLLQSCRHQR